MQAKNSRESRSELRVEYTSKPVSGWGGLVAFVRFIKQLGVRDFLLKALPDGRTSNNQVPVVDMAMQLMATVLIGGSRFDHAERVRGDEVIRRILDAKRLGSASAITRYFGNFIGSQSQYMYDTLNALILATLKAKEDVLDLDSTVFTRYGDQEGSEKGYNPHRRGARSHHPLLGMLAKSKLIVHAWLRSGSASPHRGCREFLLELLAQLPADFRISAVRADSGFYSNGLLKLLEEKGLDYAIRTKMSQGFRAWCASLSGWEQISPGREITEGIYTSPKSKIARRMIVVRETIRKVTDGVLFPITDYEYHAVVTSLDGQSVEVWRFYKGRGDCENRIKELKHDFNADGFCLDRFHGTEAVFRFICFTFNLVGLFKVAVLHDSKTTLSTIRNKIFVIGAALGSGGGRPVLRLGLTGRWREEFTKILSEASSCLSSTAAQLRNTLNSNTDETPSPWRLRHNPMIKLFVY